MPVTSIVLPPGITTLNFKPTMVTSGPSAANNVTGEKIYITPESGQDPLVVSPTFAPFYALASSLTYTDNLGAQRVLNENVDFVYVYKFVGASFATNYSIVGGIYLFNNQLNGFLTLNYCSLGGEWLYSKSIDEASIYNHAFDPFLTSWEQYAGYQKRFPIISLPWYLSDTTDFQSVVEKINTVSKTISDKTIEEARNIANIVTHITSYSDVHSIVKSDVGLANVINMPACTDAQASDPMVSTAYITPAQLQLAFSTISSSATDTVAGTMRLNDGVAGTSDIDIARGLTAPGFYSLLSTRGSAINRAIVRQHEIRVLSKVPYADPGPFQTIGTIHPVVWNSVRYNDLESLTNAIAAACGLNSIPYDMAGRLFFPPLVNIPDLTVT
jgi:hypothetical protein